MDLDTSDCDCLPAWKDNWIISGKADLKIGETKNLTRKTVLTGLEKTHSGNTDVFETFYSLKVAKRTCQIGENSKFFFS